MSTVSARERTLLIITVLIALYGVLGFSLRKQLDSLKIKRTAYTNAKSQLALERQTIADRPLIQARYDDLKALMPVFSMTKAVDTHWLSIMDNIATKEKLNIAKRQTGKENRVGEVYESAIECREWDGRLDALTRFLYDLESEGVMFDLRHLFIRPHPQNPGFLRGSFTLYCAYMRSPNAVDEPAKTAPSEGGADEGDTDEDGAEKNDAAVTDTNAVPATVSPSESVTPAATNVVPKPAVKPAPKTNATPRRSSSPRQPAARQTSAAATNASPEDAVVLASDDEQPVAKNAEQ